MLITLLRRQTATMQAFTKTLMKEFIKIKADHVKFRSRKYVRWLLTIRQNFRGPYADQIRKNIYFLQFLLLQVTKQMGLRDVARQMNIILNTVTIISKSIKNNDNTVIIKLGDNILKELILTYLVHDFIASNKYKNSFLRKNI